MNVVPEFFTPAEPRDAATLPEHPVLIKARADGAREPATAVLDALPANIALLDATGVIISVNEAWQRFATANHLGTAQAGLGVNYLEICDGVAGEDAAVARQVATGIRAVLGGTARSFTTDYACHSPTERRWFTVTVTPVAGTHPTGAVVMHRNITAWKQSEESLRLLSSAVEQVREAIIITDADLQGSGPRLLFVNTAFAQMTGFSVAEAVGQTPRISQGPRTDRAVLDQLRNHLNQGLPFRAELVNYRKDGTEYDVDLHINPLRDAAGVVTNFVAVRRDLTERKQAEARARQEQHRYLQQRNALINFADAAPPTEADLEATMRRITETSAATLGVARVSVWRYTEDRRAIRCLDLYEAAPGRHSAGLELAAADYPAYFRALEAGTVVVAADAPQHESTREFSENYLRPLGIGAMLDAPLHLGGRMEGVLCHEHVGPRREWTTDEETFAMAAANLASTALEAAERKRAQAELHSLHEQLVAASRQSGMAEIATNVLHNVGNVLNSVNVSTSLLRDRMKQSRLARLEQLAALLRVHQPNLGQFLTQDERGKHVPDYLGQLAGYLQTEHTGVLQELELVQRNVDHIKEIVAMQQHYARFGGVKEMVSMADLVTDSLRLCENDLKRQQVAVACELAPVPPVNLEKHKVLQILVNLIRNAFNACAESGRADKQVTLRVTRMAEQIQVSVQDNGVGIVPENLTRIFRHGFTTRPEGHGFGLHSGALVARELGGTLTVHSAGAGAGACFTLTLPGPTTGGDHA
jgi:PAS domain S-box-containing protein